MAPNHGSGGKPERNRPNSRKRRRPSPPPPPPPSLVQLLQSDGAVFQYFTSLQANLEADVLEWKDRAKEYERKWRETGNDPRKGQTVGSKNRKAPAKKPPGKKRSGGATTVAGVDKSRNGEKSETEDHASVHLPLSDIQQDASAVSDAILLELSSSDEDDVADELENGRRSSHTSRINDPDADEDAEIYLERKFIYGQLKDAFQKLEDLGVVLCSKETVVVQETGTDVGAEELQKVIVRRRDDEHVASDLLYAIHTLTRIQMSIQDRRIEAYAPFLTDKLLPCCDDAEGPHPVAQGKEFAGKALEVMLTYCADLSDVEWNRLFDADAEDDERIRVGMRHRRRFVIDLMASLRGEIVAVWGPQDRAVYLQSHSLHYDALQAENGLSLSTEESGVWFGSKSQPRLAAIVERRCLAQLVARLERYQGKFQSTVVLAWSYITSATPSIGMQDYSRLPPVLSICSLEGLLELKSGSTGGNLWLNSMIQQSEQSLSLRAMFLAIQATAFIYRERLKSPDNRISDVSRVELAAFERLKSSTPIWLQLDNTSSIDEVVADTLSLVGKCKQVLMAQDMDCSASIEDATSALHMAFTLTGSVERIRAVFEMAVDFVLNRSSSEASLTVPVGWRKILPVCCASVRLMQNRRLDELRVAKRAAMSSIPLPLDSVWFVDKIRVLRESLSDPVGMSHHAPSLDLLSSLAEALAVLANAEEAYRLVAWVLSIIRPDQCNGQDDAARLLVIAQLAQTPTVRVINLQRRLDRMNAFVVQAQSERLMVAKAVATLGDEGSSFWGQYAFDGQGHMEDVEERLSGQIGSELKLDALVAADWRPSDLKAFDKDARDDESLVPLSPSERACALSHVASWTGVLRSLESKIAPESPLRLVQSSGFASGRALLHNNEHMPPSPVCIIFEDDSILVDRFSDRLAALLEELPRDFHFCSLGYSRPKAAPMPQFSSQLGIPSCIWYLTGYIISLEGARYLLDSLPVKGPVDSWIGLKMCANWDNVFGQALGVGVHARSTGELPSRPDLARILQFRAFAALVPLCHQKVGASSLVGPSSAGRSWRQRDTDITFSGGS